MDNFQQPDFSSVPATGFSFGDSGPGNFGFDRYKRGRDNEEAPEPPAPTSTICPICNARAPYVAVQGSPAPQVGFGGVPFMVCKKCSTEEAILDRHYKQISLINERDELLRLLGAKEREKQNLRKALEEIREALCLCDSAEAANQQPVKKNKGWFGFGDL